MSVISGTIKLVVGITDALAAGATRLTAFNVPVQPEHSLTYADGTTAGLANRVYQAAGTLTISTPISIDLATAGCVDGSVGFTRVRELFIYNTHASAPLKFGEDGVGTNVFVGTLLGTTPQFQIEPGSVMWMSKPLGSTGFLVDGTHKNLRLDPLAVAVTYKVVVLGN
jgi:hypothetical protein